jgi:hypothetical protein
VLAYRDLQGKECAEMIPVARLHEIIEGMPRDHDLRAVHIFLPTDGDQSGAWDLYRSLRAKARERNFMVEGWAVEATTAACVASWRDHFPLTRGWRH